MLRTRNQEGIRPIEITCFFEELPLLGIGSVVPLELAVLPGYTPIGIYSNHTDMTKFEDNDDVGFQAVAGELRRWARELGKSKVSDNGIGRKRKERHSGEFGPSINQFHGPLQTQTGNILAGVTFNTGGGPVNFGGRAAMS